MNDTLRHLRSLAFMNSVFRRRITKYIYWEWTEGFSIREMADETADSMEKFGIYQARFLGVSPDGMISMEC